jgi:diketogulonate reductase-like aldo/keto reductase
VLVHRVGRTASAAARDGIPGRPGHGRRAVPAQVALRWNTQLGAVPIPRSGDRGRQWQNLDIFGFTRSDAQMTALSSLGDHRRLWGADPDVYESF